MNWKPNKAMLQALAARRPVWLRKRLKKDAKRRQQWADAMAVRLYRTEKAQIPPHYSRIAYCAACRGAVYVAPAATGWGCDMDRVKRCVWDKDRERNPKLKGHGGALVWWPGVSWPAKVPKVGWGRK